MVWRAPRWSWASSDSCTGSHVYSDGFFEDAGYQDESVRPLTRYARVFHVKKGSAPPRINDELLCGKIVLHTLAIDLQLHLKRPKDGNFEDWNFLRLGIQTGEVTFDAASESWKVREPPFAEFAPDYNPAENSCKQTTEEMSFSFQCVRILGLGPIKITGSNYSKEIWLVVREVGNAESNKYERVGILLFALKMGTNGEDFDTCQRFLGKGRDKIIRLR